MIITKLIGGLGNQMFQYAAGKRAAEKNHSKLKLDLTGYDHQEKLATKRKYELDIFKLNVEVASRDEILRYKNGMFGFWKKKYYREDPKMTISQDILNIGSDGLLDGYWQSEKYFDDIEDVIRKDFEFRQKPNLKNRVLLKKIEKSESISLHIRRGDYVTDKNTNKFHGVCDLNYYNRAIEILKMKSKKKLQLFVFSDDINWVRFNLKTDIGCNYVDFNTGDKSYEDLRLMSCCKHNIIANSSFSWWGAWLNINKNKIVVAPKHWFQDKTIDVSSRIPHKWIKV